jgi:hypothetical protein
MCRIAFIMVLSCCLPIVRISNRIIHFGRMAMKFLRGTLVVLAIITLSGCSSLTLNSAKQAGSRQLNTRELFVLVSGNTLKLTAYDFDGSVYFSEHGGISGLDNEGMTDTGRWDIKDNEQLCLKFRTWYYGDLRCYFVVMDNDRNLLSFFTPNGAAYYNGSLSEGDILKLEPEISSTQSASYVREKLAAEDDTDIKPRQTPDETAPPQAGAAQVTTAVETASTLRQLAQKCKDCNLSGADLKEAVLVRAELEGADLSGADLRYANLRRARLAGANLSGARLNHANLPGADLRGCNLRNADLSGANLLLADFTDADLTGADLTGAHIENTIGLVR